MDLPTDEKKDFGVVVLKLAGLATWLIDLEESQFFTRSGTRPINERARIFKNMFVTSISDNILITKVTEPTCRSLKKTKQ